MGNCLVLQEKMVRVMKSDAKIVEYETPIKVHQVLTQFPGHAISDSLQVLQHLHPNTKLVKGQLYYLVPMPPPPSSPKASKKKVRFAKPEVEGAKESGVVRIKMVISKQQLHDMMLQKGGISVNQLLSLAHSEKGMVDGDVSEKSDNGSQGWKPGLESIPEVN